MDLDTPEKLDPKLKEAYERMMGQKPNIKPIIENPQTTFENNKNDSLENQESKHDAYGNIINDSPKADTVNEDHSQKRSKVLFSIIVAGLVFLFVYAVIWARILNLL